AMRFEIERTAAVRHDMVLMLVAPDRHAAAIHLEEVDDRHGVEREHLRAHDRLKARHRRRELENQVECRRVDLSEEAAQPTQAEAEELVREGEEIEKQIEAGENAVVALGQRYLLAEPDLFDQVQGSGQEVRIAEGIEIANGDASAMREQLLVDGGRIVD